VAAAWGAGRGHVIKQEERDSDASTSCPRGESAKATAPEKKIRLSLHFPEKFFDLDRLEGAAASVQRGGNAKGRTSSLKKRENPSSIDSRGGTCTLEKVGSLVLYSIVREVSQLKKEKTEKNDAPPKAG